MKSDSFKRSQLLALAFVICVTVLLRYPIYPNEFAGDSLELHWYADELRQKGTQGFALNPLSWFGLYPVSYAEGVPIMAAVLGDLAGIPTDDALAICGIIIGLLGALGFFILAFKLTGSFGISLVCAASLATSGFNVPQTIWGLSGRAAVQSLFPFALWALLPNRTLQAVVLPRLLVTRLIVLVTVNITMAAFHRLFLLAVLTEVLVVVFLVFQNKILHYVPAARRHIERAPIPVFLIVGAILTWGALNLQAGVRAGPNFLREFLVTSDESLFVLGYVLEFAYDTGPFILLLAVGVVVALRGTSKWSAAMSAMLIPFGLEFFLVVPSFSSVSLAPAAGLLLGLGWQGTARAFRFGGPAIRKAAAAVLVAVALAALAFQGYFQLETQDAHRNPDGTSFYVDQESIEAGVFLRWDTANTTFVTPDLTDSRRVLSAGHVATISSEAVLFGADPSLRNNLRIEYTFENRDNPLDPFFYTDAAQALITAKTLFQAYDWIVPGSGYGEGNHWGQVVQVESSAGRILDAYHADHVLLNNLRSSSRITTLTRNNYYVEFSNSLESTYLIEHENGCLHGQRGCP